MKGFMARKTFKRELAVLLLVWFIYVVETKDVNIIEILVWPIFAFAGASFGFDAYGKLLGQPPKPTNGRRSEGSSQRTGREDELPDDRDDK